MRPRLVEKLPLRVRGMVGMAAHSAGSADINGTRSRNRVIICLGRGTLAAHGNNVHWGRHSGLWKLLLP